MNSLQRAWWHGGRTATQATATAQLQVMAVCGRAETASSAHDDERSEQRSTVKAASQSARSGS